jgi:pimeloyl-ACP methyl ester carboxylesterase
MATHVMIHGAPSRSRSWHRVVPELRARGHDVVAPDLPCDDDSATLSDYADVVVDAIGERTDMVVVAQSMAGFTAPLVCDRVPVDLLVMLAAMVPSPGEWWANTGYEQELARLLRSEDLTPIWVPDQAHEALRNLVRSRADAKPMRSVPSTGSPSSFCARACIRRSGCGAGRSDTRCG